MIVPRSESIDRNREEGIRTEKSGRVISLVSWFDRRPEIKRESQYKRAMQNARCTSLRAANTTRRARASYNAGLDVRQCGDYLSALLVRRERST